MKSVIFVFIVMLITQSCTDATSMGFQFNTQQEITGVPILNSDTVVFRYPFRVRLNDSVLYILDLHSRDFYCHSLTYPNLDVKKTFASRGDAPNTFLGVDNIRVSSTGNIYFLSANKETISIYDADTDSIKKNIKLPKELIRSLDFALINDSLFAITDYTGKHRINIVDSNGKIHQQLFSIPSKNKTDKNQSSFVLPQAWRAFIDYNPNNGILAMVTQLGQVVEIYNLKTKKTINILYGKYGEPDFFRRGGYAIPKGIMGYSDVYVGNSAIYAVFWGISFKEIQKNPLNTPEGGKFIQVFSLDGKPIKQYKLDRHITGFHIDEKNNILIGLDANNDQQIIQYQIKDEKGNKDNEMCSRFTSYGCFAK